MLGFKGEREGNDTLSNYADLKGKFVLSCMNYITIFHFQSQCSLFKNSAHKFSSLLISISCF